MDRDKYLEILLKSEVLKFGEFKTKSGRLSPYFFNMGNINSGIKLSGAAEKKAILTLLRLVVRVMVVETNL